MTTMTTMTMTMTMTTTPLATISVLDAKGADVALSTLWRDRPAVLAFVRHFG
jgi:hypothetical protein